LREQFGMEFAIVVDGAIDLPTPVKKNYPIETVVGTLRFDDEDVSDLTLDEIVNEVKRLGKLPRPGIPSPGKFLKVYEKLGKEYPYILSIHTTSLISGMFNSARTAAKLYKGPSKILLVDTGSSSLAAGLAILESIETSKTPEEIVSKVKEAIKRTGILFYLPHVESLISLRPIDGIKRILRGEVSLSDALRMLKNRGQGYLLTLKEGKVNLVDTPGSTEEAQKEILSFLREKTGGRIKYLAVGYLLRKKEAENLANNLYNNFGISPFIIKMSTMAMAGAGPDLWGTAYLTEV